MNAAHVTALFAALACAGCCQTLVIKPAIAPTCEAPPELTTVCKETAQLSNDLTYGDLPALVLGVRQDFAECRTTHAALTKSYRHCIAQTAAYNRQLKALEDELRGKYKDAKVVVHE